MAKGNIIITLFEVEKLEKLVEWCDNNIKCSKRTVGLHKDASREHYHIALIDVELPECKDIRKKYNRMGIKECITENKNLKITIYVETDEKYDEMKALAYPLKEYMKFDEILHKDKMLGITNEELEKYRIYSSTRYLAIKHSKERIEEKKEENSGKQRELDEYLKKAAFELMDENGHIKDKYKEVVSGYVYLFEKACEYNVDELGKLSFRWSDISNHVYSLLYRLNIYNSVKLIMFQQKLKYNV